MLHILTLNQFSFDFFILKEISIFFVLQRELFIEKPNKGLFLGNINTT